MRKQLVDAGDYVKSLLYQALVMQRAILGASEQKVLKKIGHFASLFVT
jgi:hypothetical protein